jgi:hypothetical protein
VESSSSELTGRWVRQFEKKLGPPTADAAYVYRQCCVASSRHLDQRLDESFLSSANWTCHVMNPTFAVRTTFAAVLLAVVCLMQFRLSKNI